MLNAALFGLLLLQAPVMPANASGGPAVEQKQQTKAETQHQKDLDKDTELGKKFTLEVEKQEKPSENKEYIERVQRIGAEIAAIAQVTPVEVLWGDKRLNKFNYTFKVLKGDDVNAFSLPGGYIYVYDGLVKYAESDDEIAGVLAHEISHAAFRHIDSLMHEQSKASLKTLPLILVAILSGNPTTIMAAIQGSQMVVQAFTSTWSIKAEKAADHGGFQYLLKSKYNPTAMLTFMERLAIDEHLNPAAKVDWGIYQTHPPGKDRAEAMLADMSKAGVPVTRSAVTTRFRTSIKEAKVGSYEIWFNKQKIFTFGGEDAKKRAGEAAAKLNDFFDKEPAMIEVSSDGQSIFGRRAKLLTVKEEDADAVKQPFAVVYRSVLSAIKGGAYSVSFNIWTSK